MIGNLLAAAIAGMCECCSTGCDCGCVLDCPLLRHREAASPQPSDPSTKEDTR